MDGRIFHVLNRGIEKRKIFFERSDYLRFLCDLYRFNNKDGNLRLVRKSENFLAEPPKQNKIVEILRWTLMPNHYHLLLQEIADGGAVEFVKRLGNGYTKYINIKNERSGYLFQNSAKIIEISKDKHFLYIPFYIDANTVELIEPNWRMGSIKNFEKVVGFLENYVWSSYKDYMVGSNFSSIANKDLFYKIFDTDVRQYKKDFFEWLHNVHIEVDVDVAG